MERLFPANWAKPNLPLRKPTSSPLAALRPGTANEAETAGARPDTGLLGNGSMAFPVIRDILPASIDGPPALIAHFCHFCGKQGAFRCERCKKVVYCSSKCQSEDWKAHRHECVSNNPEKTMEPSKEALTNGNKASQAAEEAASPLEKKYGDASIKRILMKDLPTYKNVKGEEIQGTMVEFYSPGMFFFLPQNPEIREGLVNITTELQKTYSCSSDANHEPCVGEVCAVQFSCDLNWYRGLVRSFSTEHMMANILYIDFGNEEDVPVNRIRPLAENIPKLQPCVMECRIARLVPMVEKWSGECCIAVSQMLGGKLFTVKMMDPQENGHVYAVDIQLSIGKMLSAYLVDNDFAQLVTDTQHQHGIDAILNAALENFKSLSDGKDDNNWAQPVMLTQTVGDHLSVTITHFHSPNNFLVQKVKNAGLIQDLQLKLREHCCHVAAPQNFRPAPGTVCCAQFTEDKQWYRAKILAYSSEDRVCVGYIDFGNSEEVELGHLFPISPSLLTLPMQAIPCGLSGVQPFGNTWTNDCLLAMQQRVSNRILRIEIQGAEEGKALVVMIDEASDPQANVAELLISAGYAAPAIVHTQSDQYGKKITTQAENVSPPAQEPLEWSKAELPCDNQTVVLQTVFVENPKEFYCSTSNPTDENKRKKLAAQLKLHCEADSSSFVPKLGEPCCVIFPGDGSCHRAMIKALSEDKITASLVDYGYCVKVEKSCLRSITAKLLKLPFQAIRCWLTGVEQLGSDWSSETRLWFQTRMNGCPLSARVMSFNEQGYGVELESKGQNVAAALISEHLAKDLGGMAKEMPQQPSCQAAEQPDCIKTESHIEATSSEKPIQGQIANSSTDPSFPLDWKAVELPLNEAFQPFVAGFINPSLFYLFCVNQANEEPLKQVMIDLAAYCTDNPTTLSSTTKNKPTPGAACCVQLSDHNWYRAVVLEVGENNVGVIAVDYGISEMVPFSNLMPIPVHLLKLPFQITRCTLSATKESSTTECPDDVLKMLMGGALVTVLSFDGSSNVLSLLSPAQSGGGRDSNTPDALHAHTKSDPQLDDTQKSDKLVSTTPVTATTAADRPQPSLIPETLTYLEDITGNKPGQTFAPAAQTQQSSTQESPVNVTKKMLVKQMEPPSHSVTNPTGNAIDPETTGCCCQSLKKKVDHLERLMDLQLTLTKQLLGKANI